jgi:hypothetical protein
MDKGFTGSGLPLKTSGAGGLLRVRCKIIGKRNRMVLSKGHSTFLISLQSMWRSPILRPWLRKVLTKEWFLEIN